jgi:uncharacterized protein (TIGR02594 family)
MENRELMWLELMKYYGLMEIMGPKNNPIIVNWFEEMGFPNEPDETSWCSLTINIMAKKLGLPYTGKLDAKSWMKIGTEVLEPRIGHIVVFWRINKVGWQGHVGLYAGHSAGRSLIFVLGGNESDMVTIKPYPVNSSNFGLLGFREI